MTKERHMSSKNGEKQFELKDEHLDELLKDALGVGSLLPAEEGCPAEIEIFEYVYGDIPDEITRVDIKEHLDSCGICKSRFLRMEAEKASDEWRLRKKSPLWEAYQEIQTDLNGFLAARLAAVESFLEKVTDMSVQILIPVLSGAGELIGKPAGAQSLRGGREGDGSHAMPRAAYTVGQPSQSFPLKVPPSGHEEAQYLKSRYHSLIMLRPRREDVIVQYGNRPISRPLHVSPTFGQDDVGVNELYLILSAYPLALEDEEKTLTPDRFVEILMEAESEDALVTIFEVEVKS